MRPRRPGGTGQPAGLTLTDRLTQVIEPVTSGAGFDLERVAVSRVGRRHGVQVVVDRDGGVGLDAIAEVSRAVSAALDAAEAAGAALLPGEYLLEVSSPGVDRPLTEPRHWRRNLGRLVSVPGPEGRTLTGRIVGAAAEAVVLDVDGVLRELAYRQLGVGRVQVELRHPDEPPAQAWDGQPGAGPAAEGEA
jgi:ribosome maturation factor RimP